MYLLARTTVGPWLVSSCSWPPHASLRRRSFTSGHTSIRRIRRRSLLARGRAPRIERWSVVGNWWWVIDHLPPTTRHPHDSSVRLFSYRRATSLTEAATLLA